MGRIGTVLQFIKRVRGSAFWPALKVEDRKGDNNIVEMFQTAGDDSPPLPGDNVALIDSQRQGGRLAVGVIDHKNVGVAVGGEKRIYARDNEGAVVSELHLKGDGSLLLKNTAGTYSLSINAAGAATLTCTGLIVDTPLSTFKGDVVVDGGITWKGDAQGDGGPATFVGGLENTGGDITSDSISLESHVHGGVTTGAGTTGGPQ